MVQAALTRAQQRRNQEVAGWVRWVVRPMGPPGGSPPWVPPVGPSPFCIHTVPVSLFTQEAVGGSEASSPRQPEDECCAED